MTFTCEARCPAYNGQLATGYCYYTSSPDSSPPLQLQLGQGQLPLGVELALSQMSKGEKSIYILPAGLMRSAAPGTEAASDRGMDQQKEQQLGDVGAKGSSSGSRMLLPLPPGKAEQVELVLELQDLVQVRDMTGDGQVTKRRLRDGQGEFPIDCPLHDTTVTLHYRVRQLGFGGPWVYDSRLGDATGSSRSSGGAAAVAGGRGGGGEEGGEWAAGWDGEEGAVVADTGCGELPEGLELCMKLMVPGEVARCMVQPKYAYKVSKEGGVGVYEQKRLHEGFSGRWKKPGCSSLVLVDAKWDRRKEGTDRGEGKGVSVRRASWGAKEGGGPVGMSVLLRGQGKRGCRYGGAVVVERGHGVWNHK